MIGQLWRLLPDDEKEVTSLLWIETSILIITELLWHVVEYNLWYFVNPVNHCSCSVVETWEWLALRWILIVHLFINHHKKSLRLLWVYLHSDWLVAKAGSERPWPHICGLTALTGVWLRATESEVRTTRLALEAWDGLHLSNRDCM